MPFSSSPLSRCLHLTATSFFALSAYAQLNDPDPHIWVTIYSLPAFLSLWIAVKPNTLDQYLINAYAVVVSLSYIAFSVFVFVKNSPSNTDIITWLIQDEAGREFSGLWIAILWILLMQSTIFRWEKSSMFYMVPSALVILVPSILWCYVYFHQEFRKSWPEHCQSGIYPEKKS